MPQETRFFGLLVGRLNLFRYQKYRRWPRAQHSGPASKSAELPAVLSVQAGGARVHVRGWEAPPRSVRDEGVVERERHVAIQEVVEVHAERQPLALEADDLLHREIPLPNPVSVQLARRQDVHLLRGPREFTANLSRRKRRVRYGSRRSRGGRRQRVGGLQRHDLV